MGVEWRGGVLGSSQDKRCVCGGGRGRDTERARVLGFSNRTEKRERGTDSRDRDKQTETETQTDSDSERVLGFPTERKREKQIQRQRDRQAQKHTPSTAFRQGCRKPVLGVWRIDRGRERERGTHTHRELQDLPSCQQHRASRSRAGGAGGWQLVLRF